MDQREEKAMSGDPSSGDASTAPADEASKEKGEPSLTSSLTILQRTQLLQALVAITSAQRATINDAYSADAVLSPELRKDLAPKGDAKDSLELNPNIDPGSVDVSAYDEQRKKLKARENEVKRHEVVKLKDDALKWFDGWRDEVIQRVGEVVKLKKEARKQLGDEHVKARTPVSQEDLEQDIDEEDASPNTGEAGGTWADEQLERSYPPIQTPLKTLSKEKRLLIVHSVLLTLLSLEHYSAPSRALLLYLCSSLGLSIEALDEDERQTATGLVEGAKELSAKNEAEKAADENQSARRWKVGLATAAGAALIGVTGGLAAPLVAAGVGSVMGGLGLGATAAAGYLGSLAGSTVLVGGLFGAYGGRMTGRMMDNYAKEVSDFAFLPANDGNAARKQAQAHQSRESRPKLSRQESEQHDEAAGKTDPESRRLRITIGVSGWLTSDDEVVLPWQVLGNSSEAFALRFELEALMKLGHAMQSMMTSAAWGYAKKTLISQTILAELASAVAWPVALLQVGRVVDNPFSVAKTRADKAGQVLADALINRAQGERPVSLIGYSLGARVIYSCLQTLAQRGAFGLVESAVLIGAPVPSQSLQWRPMRTVVSGRLVNIYSENDYVLGYLYRTSSVQYGVAGLQQIEGLVGIENVNVSKVISGHLRYRYLIGRILKQVGWEDLSHTGLEREKQALERIEKSQREKTVKEQGKDAGLAVAGFERTGEQTVDPQKDGVSSNDDGESEADKMEKEVQDRTQMSLLEKGARYLSIYGSRAPERKDEGESTAQGSSQEVENKTSGSQQEDARAGGYSAYLPKMPTVHVPQLSAPSWSPWSDKAKEPQKKD